MKKHKTQTAGVLEWLQRGKSITPLEALTLFGSLRLSGIIFVLRERGHNIKTEIIEVKTRAGIANVARYSI